MFRKENRIGKPAQRRVYKGKALRDFKKRTKERSQRRSRQTLRLS